jgi:hypothetical protein
VLVLWFVSLIFFCMQADILPGQVASQPAPITAGALHADAGQVAVAADPRQRRLVLGRVHRELLSSKYPAHLVHHRCRVHVGVGVHARRDCPGCIAWS